MIGPGDRIKIHDEEADRRKEQEEEMKVGGDVGQLAAKSISAHREWRYLVVTVYRAESLPVMSLKGVDGGVDAFVEVRAS